MFFMALTGMEMQLPEVGQILTPCSASFADVGNGYHFRSYKF
jgi:hypothetical protein